MLFINRFIFRPIIDFGIERNGVYSFSHAHFPAAITASKGIIADFEEMVEEIAFVLSIVGREKPFPFGVISSQKGGTFCSFCSIWSDLA